MNTRQKKVLVYAIFGAVLLAGFQNCGKVQFSNAAQDASTAVGNPSNPSNPNPNPAPAPLVCPVGSSVVNGGCQVCQSFTQLPSGNPSYVIPADGNCYSIHIINSVPTQNSSNWLTHIPYINSRLHGVSTNQNAPPGVIGSTSGPGGSINTGAVWSGNITLAAPRTVTFAGNPTGTGSQSQTQITVDNYLLLQTQSSAQGLNIFGEGSQDAVPWLNPGTTSNATGPITVNSQPINYYPFATGGTSDITPSDLSSFFPVGDQVNFSAMGLDCGSVGGISDIYLLFQ